MAPPELRSQDFRLVVVSGPDESKVFEVNCRLPNRLLIGTSESCDARLSDPTVSRRHVALDFNTSGERPLRVTDLESTNGVLVDGVAVGVAHLRGGEMIRLGDTVLRLETVGGIKSIPLSPLTAFGKMVGESGSMRRLYPLCQRLARSDVPVVIEGETGTGKEVLAEALHYEGLRPDGPFVVLDCAAVAEGLMELELFGQEANPTMGVGVKRGVFERASGGSLLIDEIAELNLETQGKLLRAIDRAEVTRIGGMQSLKVDVRIIVATRRSLDSEVERGAFRADLYHRLSVARLELPPLRERDGDIARLAALFWAHRQGPAEGPPKHLVERWEGYNWPGNVRELRNAVARTLVLGDVAPQEYESDLGDVADPRRARTLPGDTIAQVLTMGLRLKDARQLVVEEFESRYVEQILEQSKGSVTRAAATAGIARRHLQRLKARSRDR